MNRWAGIARLGGIGDNLMAASVFKSLKKMGYSLDVITASPNHVVYLHNPYIDKLSIKADGDIPKDLLAWQAWFASRAKEYDLFLHASHSCEGRHAVFETMTSFWWPDDYRRQLCGGSYIETVHDIVGAPYDFGPLYFVSDEEKERALNTKKQIGERFVAWVISGTRIDKLYPAAALAISRIIKELDIPVVMFGAPNPKEHSCAKAIQDFVETHNSSLKGLHLAMSVEGADPGGDQSWPIRRALALVHAADVVVSPDTGAAWSVAFEPIPKVLMVSHASVENITKHWINTVTLHADPDRVPCWPCHRLHDRIDTCTPNKDGNGAACISDISVESVITNVRLALTQKTSNVIPLKTPAALASF